VTTEVTFAFGSSLFESSGNCTGWSVGTPNELAGEKGHCHFGLV